MTFDELPQDWQEKIRRLRRENAKFRTERNTLRAALERVLKTGEQK